MKKLIIITLVLTMLFSMIAYGAEFSDLKDDAYSEAVSYLHERGFISGYPDGTIKLERPITRAEVSIASLRILGHGDVDSVEEATFSDTRNHWAKDYIEKSKQLGLLTGYPDGTFKPDSKITYDEAITIIVRMCEDESTISELKLWPTDYINYAKENGYLKNLNYEEKYGEANRGDTFLIIYNALTKEQNYSNLDFNNYIERLSISTTYFKDGEKGRYSSDLPKNNIDNIVVKINLNHEAFNKDEIMPINIELTNVKTDEKILVDELIDIKSETESTSEEVLIDIEKFNFGPTYYDEFDNTDFIVKAYYKKNILDSKKISFYWDNSKEEEYSKDIKINELKFYAQSITEYNNNDLSNIYYTNTFYFDEELNYISAWGEIEWPETEEYLTIPLTFILDGKGILETNLWFNVYKDMDTTYRNTLLSIYHYKGDDHSWDTGTYDVEIKAFGETLIKDSFKIKW